jgi:hypothetical protein
MIHLHHGLYRSSNNVCFVVQNWERSKKGRVLGTPKNESENTKWRIILSLGACPEELFIYLRMSIVTFEQLLVLLGPILVQFDNFLLILSSAIVLGFESYQDL